MKKQITVFALSVLIGCTPHMQAAEVLPNQEQVAINSSYDDNKANTKYIATVKKELAKLKAFKEPFAKLSGWGPTIVLSGVGFILALYMVRIADEYAMEHDLILQQRIDGVVERSIATNQTLNYYVHMVDKNKLYSYMSTALGCLPWFAAVVNKWLDFSCQSYERDLKEAQSPKVLL